MSPGCGDDRGARQPGPPRGRAHDPGPGVLLMRPPGEGSSSVARPGPARSAAASLRHYHLEPGPDQVGPERPAGARLPDRHRPDRPARRQRRRTIAAVVRTRRAGIHAAPGHNAPASWATTCLNSAPRGRVASRTGTLSLARTISDRRLCTVAGGARFVLRSPSEQPVMCAPAHLSSRCCQSRPVT
jgi:hypothetical protein